jgi:mannose/fructose/N-acetylgalactosamine-specific phosphotransferase system component IID
MTIGQIIVFTLICFAFWLGNRSGYANGYVAGRKAVRKYYEKQLQQVGR